MNSKIVRRIIIATLVCSMFIPNQQALAAEKRDSLKSIERKQVQIKSSDEIRFEIQLSSKVFADCTEGFVSVLAGAEDGSEVVGKVYENSVLSIVESDEVWCKVQSGNVIGYIRKEQVLTGKAAIEKASAILIECYPDRELFDLTTEEIEAVFSVGETVAEEATRIAAEEAARLAAEEEARRQKRTDLVNYAKRFLGNPYVYGGTSLTKGTDCSGFVKSVYSHFGVYLPRTSYAMRKVGRSVSYSDIQPGDIVCYSGHVGIYAGNGQIVNAIDESRGIGMSNLRYKRIITIRRIF